MRYSCVALIAAAVVGTASAGESKTLVLDAHELRVMTLDTGPGFLRINGVDGNRIEVAATIVADSGDYELALERKGDRAVLVAEVEPWAAIFLAEWPRIDLTVSVPNHLLLDIDDSAGYIAVSDMRADLEIDDGSGGIVIRSLLGNLDIDDGSGEIDVAGVTGKISVEDGSGEIRIENVVGDVHIKDGSGAMSVQEVNGHVTIRDGSGAIAVSRVKRGLTIRDSGSGSLHTSEIEGGIREH